MVWLSLVDSSLLHIFIVLTMKLPVKFLNPLALLLIRAFFPDSQAFFQSGFSKSMNPTLLYDSSFTKILNNTVLNSTDFLRNNRLSVGLSTMYNILFLSKIVSLSMSLLMFVNLYSLNIISEVQGNCCFRTTRL